MSTPIVTTTAQGTRVDMPAAVPANDGVFVRVDVTAVGSPHKSWQTPATIYFTRSGGAWKLVGLERVPDGAF
jgi:hypothetical protein